MNTEQNRRVPITRWDQFTKLVRSQGCHLLQRLGDFPDAVLVSGCQRSGTTIMARIITQSQGMVNYWFGSDDELDAALILSGQVDHTPSGRYCFQTTYLDECYQEYTQHDEAFKIIWVIRNPYSVVYSLMYHWPVKSLKGTFAKCASYQLVGPEKNLFQWLGPLAVSRVRQASLLFKAKTLQLFDLINKLGKDRIFIVDYDELVMHKEVVLPKIYAFIELDYNSDYCQQIHSNSVKKKNRLSRHENEVIKSIAEPVYLQALELKNLHYPISDK